MKSGFKFKLMEGLTYKP